MTTAMTMEKLEDAVMKAGGMRGIRYDRILLDELSPIPKESWAAMMRAGIMAERASGELTRSVWTEERLLSLDGSDGGRAVRQKARDDAERARVKTLNWLIETGKANDLYGLRGLKRAEFIHHDLAPASFSLSMHRTSATNIDRLKEVLVELGFADPQNTMSVHTRNLAAHDLAEHWSENSHKAFMQHLGKSVAPGLLDDGIDLDAAVDLLLEDDPIAGTW